MACVIDFRAKNFARGCAIHLGVNLAVRPPDNYVVCVTQDAVIEKVHQRLSFATAVSVYDELEQLYFAEPFCGWRATLARLREPGRVQPCGRWQGSVGEYVAQFFDVGTWEWVHALHLTRQRLEEARQAPKQNAA